MALAFSLSNFSPWALEVSVVVLGIFLLLVEAFASKIDRRVIGWSAIAALVAVLAMSFLVEPTATGGDDPFYRADFLAMFFKKFMLLSTIVVILLSIEYAGIIERFMPGETPQAGVGEYLFLPVFTCAGLMWMVSAADFVMIFVSLELVTMSFYVMVAYMRRNVGSLEAGTKYLILGALSTGFLVYGITWIFGYTGTTSLRGITEALAVLPVESQPGILFGLGMVLVALGFKIAAFPFQFWVPDVYQGAPSPTTAFLSVASKAAGIVVLLRVLEPFLNIDGIGQKLTLTLVVVAAATLIFGNFGALLQKNLKRLLAYSSVAHAGYLLVAVASFGSLLSGQAIVVYLAGYLLMTFLAFYVLILVSRAAGGDDIDTFKGLAKRSPFLAFALLVSMISLAGLPFTVGFIGKFMVFAAAVEAGNYILLAIGAITVACGFYYYLKVVRAMYWQDPVENDDTTIEVSPVAKSVMIAAIALIFILGVYPEPILMLLN